MTLLNFCIKFFCLIFSIFLDKGGTTCEFTMAQAFKTMGGHRNENISHIPFDEESRNRSIYEDILNKSSQQSRVIAICASNIIIRNSVKNTLQNLKGKNYQNRNKKYISNIGKYF